MADNRIPSSGVKSAGPAKHTGKSGKPAPAPAPAAKPAKDAQAPAVTAQADTAIAKNLGTGNLHDLDSLLDQAVSKTVPAAGPAAPPQNPTVAMMTEALTFPPKPTNPADQKAWTLDAYRRVLKATTGMHELEKDWQSHKVDGNTLSAMRSKIWNAEQMLADADKDGSVKKEFFAGVLPNAKAMIDGLKDFPPAPKDAAGKKAWLAEGQKKLAEATAADNLMRDAWFEFKALDFDKMADSQGKLAEFRWKLDTVNYELNPPPKRAPGKPGAPSGPNGPLFGNTQGVADALNKHPNNPVVQVGGAIALPIAMTIDVLDAITRPFVWLDQHSPKH